VRDTLAVEGMSRETPAGATAAGWAFATAGAAVRATEAAVPTSRSRRDTSSSLDFRIGGIPILSLNAVLRTPLRSEKVPRFAENRFDRSAAHEQINDESKGPVPFD
jgi:hypothetical protein